MMKSDCVRTAGGTLCKGGLGDGSACCGGIIVAGGSAVAT
ncbi:hypothetical protein ACVISU_003409 [Bradyrhizobium sp. USDA 4452]